MEKSHEILHAGGTFPKKGKCINPPVNIQKTKNTRMSAAEEPKKKYERPKCPHGKQPYYCAPCGGKGVCEHGKTKSSCGQCKNGSAYCEHKTLKQKCRECNPAYFCEHGSRKDRCTQCKTGTSICSHGKLKARCKECHAEGKQPAGLCEHGTRKEYCLDCIHAAAICEHRMRRSRCKVCLGSEICSHGNNKYCCTSCKDNPNVCEHKKLAYQCPDCLGRLTCEHGTRKAMCTKCDGSYVCIHSRQKNYCTICSPQNACQHCFSAIVYHARFKPFCTRCYCALHPELPVARRYKLKEHFVRDGLIARYGDKYTMTFDKRVDGGCSLKRPDVLIDFGTHVLIVEVDEHRHASYTCEMKRMVTLYEDVGFRKVVFLRFNPDDYTEDGVRYRSPFQYPNGNDLEMDEKEIGRRMDVLYAAVEESAVTEPVDMITTTYLFFGDMPMEEAWENDVAEQEEEESKEIET